MMNENLKKIFKYDSVWQARLYIGAKTFISCYIQLIVIIAGLCLIGYLKYVQKMSASPIIQYVMFLMIVSEIINDADIAIVTSQFGGFPLYYRAVNQPYSDKHWIYHIAHIHQRKKIN